MDKNGKYMMVIKTQLEEVTFLKARVSLLR